MTEPDLSLTEPGKPREPRESWTPEEIETLRRIESKRVAKRALSDAYDLSAAVGDQLD